VSKISHFGPKIEFHIGIDDTDSVRGGCTTYIAAQIIRKLVKEFEVEFIDYPNLIRLNPNVPYKTRGNGAVAIRVLVNENLIEEIKRTVIQEVEKWFMIEDEKTNPGIAFLRGKIPTPLKCFAKKVIRDIVEIEEAERIAKMLNVEIIGYKERRGIIGALAAVGETLDGDYTYELLAYRKRENWGTPRRVDPQSVMLMDRETFPLTFNNVDYETGRILITPHGPDPVLFGIRGENPRVLIEALKYIKTGEPIACWVIFRTNQGTDDHLIVYRKISELRPYLPCKIKAIVDSKPEVIEGGHVIVRLRDETGAIDAAAYEPTGDFRKIIQKLEPGDEIIAYGGVRPLNGSKFTVNLEKIEIVKLARKFISRNPKCPKCGKRMKSLGRSGGYRCKKCGLKLVDAEKEVEEIKRDLKDGLYIPPPRAHRHLTKPYQRYGLEKKRKETIKLHEPWYYFSE